MKDLTGITKALDRFNCHKSQLSLQNGIIDLKTGELIEHSKDLLFTQHINIEYCKSAKCPRWEQFLFEIFQGDLEQISFLKRALGYNLTGLTTEQVLFFLIGPGENGKSTIGNVILSILSSITSQADFNTFLESKSEKIRNDIARLHNSRIVFASESSAEKYLDEGAIKQMTGGDIITARFLFKEYFEYHPQFKIWLITNQFPKIKQGDHALWRRIIPIIIDYKVPKKNRDNNLLKKLLVEKQGILYWLIQGAKEWYKMGLNPPVSIFKAKAELQYEADTIKIFIDEKCELNQDSTCKSSILYQSYKNWAEINGYNCHSIQLFTKKLKDLGITQKRASRVRYWKGIKI